jgi:hypothetical protein
MDTIKIENKEQPIINASNTQNERLVIISKLMTVLRGIPDAEYAFIQQLIIETEHGLNNNVLISQVEMAKKLGLTKQHMNTVVTNLVGLKLITKNKKYFSINLENLTLIKPRKKTIKNKKDKS